MPDAYATARGPLARLASPLSARARARLRDHEVAIDGGLGYWVELLAIPAVIDVKVDGWRCVVHLDQVVWSSAQDCVRHVGNLQPEIIQIVSRRVPESEVVVDVIAVVQIRKETC